MSPQSIRPVFDMSSRGWSFSRLQGPDPPYMKYQTLAEPPQLSYFEPHCAYVRRPSVIPTSLTLLGIPPEVRDQIWETILNDIRSKPKGMWYRRPHTDYDGLSLVCRQIYHEIAYYWPRSIIPQHRLGYFLSQPFSLSAMQGFKSLSIEIPFNMSSQFFLDMGNMLIFLSPYLQLLSVFFTGADAYGTQTFLHGCGNKDASPKLKKLPIDGQGFTARYNLINAFSILQNLRSLSIQNSNLPLMQAHILPNKPYLERLHIECDPRSSLHYPWKVRNCGYGLMMPVCDNFPPVRELYISANAALLSVQVVSKLDVTLRKLTWVCPDPARQTGSMAQDYLRDTDIILSNLRSNARGLHTLRICIEGAVYESLQAYGVLIGSLRMHLPHLLPLRNLELHIFSKSSWFGKEVVQAFPAGLERAYFSERLVDLQDLLPVMQSRYLGVTIRGPGIGKAISTEHCESIDTKVELGRTDSIPLYTGTLTFLSYQYMDENGNRVVMKEVEDDIKTESPEMCDDHDKYSQPEGAKPLVSDDAEDTGSESTGTDDKNNTETDKSGDKSLLNENPRICLLKLNGRLLDRARNKHLVSWPRGAHIPSFSSLPSTPSSGTINDESLASPNGAGSESNSPSIDAEVPTPEHAQIEAAVKTLQPPTISEVRTNNTMLNIGGFRDDYDYFGNEKAAEAVFRDERVTKVDEVEMRTYPVEVDMKNEHWICP